MGFAVYRGGDWKAEEFDTGASKIWASLANIPRQILEGAQMRKEGELKEREMANKEAGQRSQEKYQTEALAKDQQQIDLAKEGVVENRRRYEEEKPMKAAQLAAVQEQTRATRMHADALNAKISQDKQLMGHSQRVMDADMRRTQAENDLAGVFAVYAANVGKDGSFKGGGIFRDPEKSIEFQTMVNSMGLTPKDYAEGLKYMEQKYTGEKALLNPAFQTEYNRKAIAFNATNNVSYQLHARTPGSPIDPNFDAPTNAILYKGREVQDQAIDQGVSKLQSKDPRVPQFFINNPDKQGNPIVAAIIANLQSKKRDSLIASPEEYNKFQKELDAIDIFLKRQKADALFNSTRPPFMWK